MKCYTYTSGQLTPGIELNGKNQKTCAINLNIPFNWDDAAFIQSLRSREYADILLYGVTKVVEGDSCSSVFPANCALIRVLDILSVKNHEDSCFELGLTSDKIEFILFDGSSLSDAETGNYLVNDNGELKVLKEYYRPGKHLIDENYTGDYEISL